MLRRTVSVPTRNDNDHNKYRISGRDTALYLPEAWLTPGQRTRAQIPASVGFEPKARLALRLLRQVRAAGFKVTAVVGDAEFGDNATLRRTLQRAHLPYALGVSSDHSWARPPWRPRRR